MNTVVLSWKDRLFRPRGASQPLEALDALAEWLARAQDASGCGGVSSHYDVQKKRWAAAYPETTGYIIPTLFNYAELSGRADFRERALRMTDWETEIQLADGGVRAGTLDAPVVAPTIFNTGQVLFGWARTFEETRDTRFRDALQHAANWLLAAQDEDGAWRKFASPVASHGVNAYNTRTAFGLTETARVLGNPVYLDAARRNVAWALGQAEPNGWLPNNCLEDNERPLTHTIAYAIRGILEVSVAAGDAQALERATTMAQAVARRQRPDGALPGRLDRNWCPAARWSCLTGNAQMAIIWLRLAKLVGTPGLRNAADKAIRFNLSVLDIGHPDPGVRGGVKGSHPLDGGYMRYRYPSWAAKFLADALMLREAPDRIA